MKWLRKFCSALRDLAPGSIIRPNEIVAPPDSDYRDAKIVELEKEVGDYCGALRKALCDVKDAKDRLAEIEKTSRIIKREETEADLLLLCVRTAIDVAVRKPMIVEKSSMEINELTRILTEQSRAVVLMQGQAAAGMQGVGQAANSILGQLMGYQQQQRRQ